MTTAKTRKPARYRDVLAMLKAMAREPSLTSDAIRSILAGNIGEGPESYTQADIRHARELAAKFGWELSTVPEKAEDDAVVFESPERYQEEIRRLHGLLGVARQTIKNLEHGNVIALEKSKQRNAARRAQLDAAGVKSIDEAFARLAVFRESCTCGAEQAFGRSAESVQAEAAVDR